MFSGCTFTWSSSPPTGMVCSPENTTTSPREVFTKVCADFGANLTECNREDDHVHLLIEYPPQAAVPRLVNSLKGMSPHRPRQHAPLWLGPHRAALGRCAVRGITYGPRRTSPRPAAAHPCRSSNSTSRTSAIRHDGPPHRPDTIGSAIPGPKTGTCADRNLVNSATSR